MSEWVRGNIAEIVSAVYIAGAAVFAWILQQERRMMKISSNVSYLLRRDQEVKIDMKSAITEMRESMAEDKIEVKQDLKEIKEAMSDMKSLLAALNERTKKRA